jgi:hypothetical protein
MRRKATNPERNGTINPRQRRETRGARKRPTGRSLQRSHSALLATRDSTERFYVDSGASDHLILHETNSAPIENLRSASRYQQPTVARTGATSANGLGRKVDLQDVYYAPGVHTRLVSLGKLDGQGWDVRLRDGGVELRDRDGDLFANVAKVNNVYPMGLKVTLPMARLAAWTTW